MSKVTINGKECTAYYGDHKEVTVYNGSTKLYGAVESEQTGELLTFENTYNGTVQSMPIEGSTTQFITTGKNLLDLSTAKGGSNSGITVTVNGDGSYTVNGTATSGSINVWFEGSYSETAETLFTLPAGTYTAYGINLYSGTTSLCRCYEADNFVNTFTIAEDTNVTGVRCCMLTSGNTYTNKIFFPQLEEGTTATAYEPYTGGQPSPSPSYPQELVPLTVSGQVTGANIIPPVADETGSRNGLTWTIKDGVYTVNGTATAGTYILSTVTDWTIPVTGTGYYMYEYAENKPTTSPTAIFYNDGSLIDAWSFSNGLRTVTGWSKLSGHACDQVGVYIPSGSVCENSKFWTMICPPSLFNNEYEQGKEHVDYTTTLYEGQTADFGKGVETDEWSVIGVDDLASVTFNSSTERFILTLNVDFAQSPVTTRTLKMYSNCYVCQHDGETFSKDWDNVFYNHGSSTNIIYLHDHRFTDASSMLSALSDVKFLVPLATPTTTTIDTLPTYYPTTVISCDEEVTAKVLVADA